ncbi:MAG: lytic transglycosylase domain-containing protein, partial [Desulfobulbaceae bacterium]|nr:lytic transglycosylase domain-containing protein [Desulfobulbaceae bacterium]
MKSRITIFFRYLFMFALLFVLSGCAGIGGFDSDEGDSAWVDLEPAGEIEDRVVVESEETLRDELSGLDQLGEWDGGTADISTPQYDFPVTTNKQVEFYLELFQNKQHKHFARWLSRSKQYLTMIKPRLREAELPEDLAYLAMIESGFNPTAYSRAHASGLWQFIQSTGKNYGLRVDGWVDERRDPEKATEAAISYLGNLYHEFDDWYLAVASYNAGEGKIRRAIERYNTRDFWQLARNSYLSLETKRYVPKLIAAIIIAKEPEKYGFGDIEFESEMAYEEVEVPPLTTLDAVALCC